MPFLPVYLRENFNAASTASAPLLLKNVSVIPFGANLDSFCRNLNLISLYRDIWHTMSFSAWFLTACTTLSLQCPTIATPYPPIQSIYSLPDVSQSFAPLPRPMFTGNLWYKLAEYWSSPFNWQ